NCKGLDRLPEVILRHSRNKGGVNSTAEQHANFHIGHELPFNCLAKQVAILLHEFVEFLLAGAHFWSEDIISFCNGYIFATQIEADYLSGLHLLYTFIYGIRRTHITHLESLHHILAIVVHRQEVPERTNLR